MAKLTFWVAACRNFAEIYCLSAVGDKDKILHFEVKSQGHSAIVGRRHIKRRFAVDDRLVSRY